MHRPKCGKLSTYDASKDQNTNIYMMHEVITPSHCMVCDYGPDLMTKMGSYAPHFLRKPPGNNCQELNLPGRMVLHPEDIWIVGLGTGTKLIPQRSRSTIHPFAHFRMAVGEGESPGPIVITRRPINHFCFGFVWIVIHRHNEETVVDAVVAFIEQDISHRRTRIAEGCRFGENPPQVFPPSTVVSVNSRTSGILRISTARPDAHGHAARTRHALLLGVDSKAGVRRAAPNSDGLARIIPNRASGEKVGIPIVLSGWVVHIDNSLHPSAV